MAQKISETHLTSLITRGMQITTTTKYTSQIKLRDISKCGKFLVRERVGNRTSSMTDEVEIGKFSRESI